MNKRIYLVSLNARYTHSTLSHYYQMRLIEENGGYTYNHLVYSINADAEKIVLQLAGYHPEIVCFSVYIWNVDLTRRIIDDLHSILPETVFVVGGPEVEFPNNVWQGDWIITVSGKEGCFRNVLQNGFAPKKYIETDEQKIPFHDVPFPYSEYDLTALKNRYVYYESSRGCGRACSYCLSSAQSCTVEFKDIETVLPEIQKLIDAGLTIVKFIDRTFNYDRDHAQAIWRYILQHNSSTVFHFEIDASLLSESDFSLLKKVPAGMFDFEIGVQSTHPPTLVEIGRGKNIEKNLNMIKKLINETSIHVHVDLIAGLPYEGIHEFEKSFNDVIGLGADLFQLGFLKLLPGTRMEENKVKYGTKASQYAPYQVYATKWMTEKEMLMLLDIEQLVENIYNRKLFSVSSGLFYDVCGGPFAFYKRFSVFCSSSGFEIGTKKIDKIASALKSFAVSVSIDSTGIVDSLVFDYFTATNALSCSFDDISDYRKNSREFFQFAEQAKLPFTPKQYAHKSVVYVPESDEFYRYTQYRQGTKFCFINGIAESGLYGDYAVIVRGYNT